MTRAAVVHLEDRDAVKRALYELLKGVEAGRICAVALIAADSAGGLEPWWGASRTLGAHGGTLLRGAVAYLGAKMDQEALEP